MDEYMLMLVGFVAGCITVIVIWGVTALIRSRIGNRRSARREEIIATIEGKWSDIDSIVSSYKAGRFTASKFREFLGEKLETINRTYRPYIHQLDIFFVKYTENLIENYSRMISPAKAGEAIAEPMAGAVAEADETLEQPATREMPAAEEREIETSVRPVVEAEAPQAEQEEPEAAAAAEEEPVIAAMTEAAKEEDELPIETFLEMGTGTGTVEESAVLEGTAGEHEEVSLDRAPAPEAADVNEPVEEEEQLVSQEAIEQSEEYAPPLPAESEIPMPQASMEYPEETIQERPFSFATQAENAQSFEVPPPPAAPEHHAPPPPPPRPAYTRDESVQPATIYDVEAETIIADRSEILKAPAPEPEQAKSNLGITGDDVSDMLDQFFGGPKKKK